MSVLSRIRETLCSHQWYYLDVYSLKGCFATRSVCLKCGKHKIESVRRET